MWFAKLAKNYLLIEISDRVKNSEPKTEFIKEKKDYFQSVPSFKKKGEAKSSSGASFSGYKKPGNFSVEKDMKDIEWIKFLKKGHYANKCREIKAQDTKVAFKVRKLDDSSVKEEEEVKSIPQICIRYWDLKCGARRFFHAILDYFI